MALTLLRRARLEHGLTQLRLSIKTGIAPSRLSVLERGILRPTPQEAAQIAGALNVTVDTVLCSTAENDAAAEDL